MTYVEYLTTVVWKIEKALNSEQHALGAFLDIVGAFNMI